MLWQERRMYACATKTLVSTRKRAANSLYLQLDKTESGTLIMQYGRHTSQHPTYAKLCDGLSTAAASFPSS